MPYTLLLADDSVTIQRVIELTFADEDVNVIAVSDGDQAIARLESTSPDIVLADIGMPGKTGYEVAKHIKQSPAFSHIPVVLLTGAFEPVDQERANEAGCDGVLAKPFEPQLVISRVKELLAKSAPRAAAAPPPPAPEPPPPPAPAGPVAQTSSPQPAPPPPAPQAAPPLRSRTAAPLVDDTLEIPTADEQWGTPSPQTTAPGPAAASRNESLDDYFDRLDDAFQHLGGPPPSPAGTPDYPLAYPTPEPAAHDEPVLHAHVEAPAVIPEKPEPVAAPLPEEPEPVAAPAPPPEIVPAAFAAPAPKVEPAVAASAPAFAYAPVELPKITALPSLADAFAAILAAEEKVENGENAAAIWPATVPSTDALVDQVTQRVLDRLSDQVVRDTVSDIVSQIAERLVQEEIERIKAAIK